MRISVPGLRQPYIVFHLPRGTLQSKPISQMLDCSAAHSSSQQIRRIISAAHAQL